MTYTVYVRNNTTGETRTVPWDTEWDPVYDEYFWSEGNNACDCNRDSLFKLGTNEPHEHICGMTKYWVEIKDENGKVLYSDDS